MSIDGNSHVMFATPFSYKLITIATLILVFEQAAFAQSDIDFFYTPAAKNYSTSTTSTKPYVPASLVKLVTAAHALFTFGGNHRFSTKIYLTPQNELVIEGQGNPDLTSESLKECLAKSLAPMSNKKIIFERIILDGSKYESRIEVPGQGGSSNPYDASVGALAINFNSVALDVKNKSARNREVLSGEKETPLTPYAKQLGKNLPPGKHRISIINNGDAERQLYELASIFLLDMGFRLKSGYLIKPRPENSKLLGDCQSQSLENIIQAMLKYSNNFSANQIFLNTGTRYYGYPASLKKSSKSLTQFMREEVGVKDDFIIEEGAGLSRSNSLTPEQLMLVLRYFEPYKQLLPESDGVFYKSGTLKGVSNLAGYVTEDGKILGYFSMFGSQSRSIEDRIRIAVNAKNR